MNASHAQASACWWEAANAASAPASDAVEGSRPVSPNSAAKGAHANRNRSP